MDASLIAIGLAVIAIGLMLAVRLDRTERIDRALLSALLIDDHGRPRNRSPRLDLFMRDTTALGGDTVLTLVLVSAALFGVASGMMGPAYVLILCAGGGRLIGAILKRVWRRLRPDLLPDVLRTFSSSFPSVHAIVAITLYGGLTMLYLAHVGHEQAPIAAAVAGTLIALIGFSRLYHGVHWPSDVLAGFAIGGLWCLVVFQYLTV